MDLEVKSILKTKINTKIVSKRDMKLKREFISIKELKWMMIMDLSLGKVRRKIKFKHRVGRAILLSKWIGLFFQL